MVQRLEGKVAIVTGSGRGIGKSIALCYAREGADIVITDNRVSEMESAVAEIVGLGRKAVSIKADVSKKDEVENLMTIAVDYFGKIDILVNNAGITQHAPFLQMKEEDWDVVLGVNLKGVFLCTQIVARHMVEKGYGKIINMASVHSFGATTEMAANYAASKGGIIALTKVCARALGKYGINVNVIAPGTIATDLIQSRRTSDELEAFKEEKKKITLLGRIGTVQDVANLALFLASDESSFLTGTSILCDGGRIDKL